MSKFKVGDYVKYTCGKVPLVVTRTKKNCYGNTLIEAKYIKSGKKICDELEYSFVKYEGEIPMNVNNEQLYELFENGTTTGKYGYMCGKNRDGKFLFEQKGSGDIIPVEKDQLVEVVPYTVALKFIESGDISHHEVKEGLLNKGDLLVSASGGMHQVTSVDTKNKHAEEFKPSSWKRVPLVDIE